MVVAQAQAVIKKQGVFEMVNAPSESNPYRTVTNALLFIKPKDASKVIVVENDSEIVLTLPTLKHQVYLNGSKLSVSSRRCYQLKSFNESGD